MSTSPAPVVASHTQHPPVQLTGPLSKHQIVPILTEDDIQRRIKALAEDINATYANCDEITIIAILKGSFLFLSDLIRHITVPCQIEFVRLASYGHTMTSTGNVKTVDLTLPSLEGKDVLLVEDIIDTGLTLSFFVDYLNSLHKTRSTRLAVLLDKPGTRSQNIAPLTVDFTGFQVGNEFLIGYGLDYGELYRNLPYIAKVMPD